MEEGKNECTAEGRKNESNGKGRKIEWGGWYVLALLFVVAILNYLDRTMIATMRSSIVDSISMTDAQFGLLTSVFSWVYGAFCPIAGYLADRYKKTYLIIGSLFVWSLVTMLTGYVTTYEQLFYARALMGISEAFFIPAALSILMDSHKNEGLAIGILFSGEMLGQSFGFLGGRIAENHSWNEAFFIFGIVGIAYAVFLIFTLKEKQIVALREKKKAMLAELNAANVSGLDTEKVKKEANIDEPKPSIGATLKALFSKWSYFYLLLIYPLPTIVSWMAMGWLPTYYQETFNLSQSVAGEFATVYLYPASILGLLLGGFLSDKWQKSFPYARIVVPIIGFGVAAPAVFMIGYIHVLWQAVAMFLMYGFARMFIDANLMPILRMVVDERYQATGYGIINMLTVFIGGLSTYVAGALHDAHIPLATIYQYASLGLVLCIGLLFLVMRSVRKSGIVKKRKSNLIHS